MSDKAFDFVTGLKYKSIPGRVLLLTIANHTGRQPCRLSLEDLAGRASLSIRAAKGHVARLVAAGLLARGAKGEFILVGFNDGGRS